MVWKKLDAEEVFRSRWMSVSNDRVLTDDGTEIQFGVVHKAAAVLVIAWDGERTVLVGQYRYPVNLFSWEFVQGHMEHASLEEAARHELEEEAGLSPANLVKIGTFYLAPGHHTQEYQVFVASSCSSVPQKLECTEQGMQVRHLSLSDVEQMIARGEIRDSPTITALKLFEIYLAKR